MRSLLGAAADTVDTILSPDAVDALARAMPRNVLDHRGLVLAMAAGLRAEP